MRNNSLFEGFDECNAEFSEDQLYRYTLTRQWNAGVGRVAWIMFNPSTADAKEDDPTIRKCIGFSRRWGYRELVILNLYAIRGTDPRTPSRTNDPVGPENDKWISESIRDADLVVYAWGCAQHMKNIGLRVSRVRSIAALQGKKEVCLGYREDGHPRHPLMLSYETQRIPFGVLSEKKES